MLQISSVYLTAAATLFGVLLTVIVQAITAATQRRHDRIARTFDVRLELYTKTRRIISNWSMAYQSTRQLQSDLSTLIGKIRDISSNESNTTDQVATLPRETVEQHVKKIEENVSTLAHHVQNLRATERELKEVSHTVALLAGKPVDEALQDVLNKMASNTKPTKLDFDKFDQAARKELGMKL